MFYIPLLEVFSIRKGGLACFKQCFAWKIITRIEIFSRTNLYLAKDFILLTLFRLDSGEIGGVSMLLGLMSDTHDNLPMVEKAIDRFNAEKVQLVLHAGDYVAPFVIPKFKRLKARLTGVFGNNDGDHELLKKRFSENKNLEIRERFALVTVDGLKIALLHGDEEELLNALIDSGGFDVVVHGHGHNAGVRRKGKTLVACPGEVCGYLTGKSTIAILDTAKLEAKIVEL
jgi:putative phosphoesterase